MPLNPGSQFVTAFSLLLLGCGDPINDPDESRWDLVMERGVDQVGPVVTLLPQSLLAQVLLNGVVTPNALVTVEISDGNASLWIPGRNVVFGPGANLTERTGRDGRSEFFLGVGQEVGSYTFAVTVNRPINGDSAKVVMVFAVAGGPELVTVGGDNQVGDVSTRLPQALSLVVTDAFGNPTPQIPVRWTVTSGSGSTTDSVTVTDESGLSTNQWDLGAMIGVQTMEAIIDTLPPILFSATAN